MVVSKDSGPLRNHRLAEHTVEKSIATGGKTGLDSGANFLTGFQLHTHKLRDDFARDIIGSGPKPAGHKKDIRTVKSLQNPIPNRGTVGYRRLSREAKTEWKDLFCQPTGVSIYHLAEQELSPDIENFNNHGLILAPVSTCIQDLILALFSFSSERS